MLGPLLWAELAPPPTRSVLPAHSGSTLKRLLLLEGLADYTQYELVTCLS